MAQQVKIATRWRGTSLSVGMSGAGSVEQPPPTGGGEPLWQHGGIVELTPDMFGLETFGADPNMRLFDTVDNQSAYDAVVDGAEVPVGPGYLYEARTANRPILLEADSLNARHLHDTKRYKIDGRGYLERPYSLPVGHEFGRKLFFEVWLRYEEPVTAGENAKITRIWGENAAGDERYSSYSPGGQSYVMGQYFYSNEPRDNPNWMRFTVEIDASSGNLLQWRGRYWVNGVLDGDEFATGTPETGSDAHPDLTWGPPIIGLLGYDPRTPEATFGDDWRQVRMTDLYMAVGPERFVLTDNANFSATGAYEVQEIVSWSPSLVQVRLFAGALGSVAGKRLHFVGSGNQAVGTSYQIGDLMPVTHGSIVTLAGTGFGTRGDYGAVAPNPADNGTLAWTVNDFEGDDIPGDTGWNFNAGGDTHWEHVWYDPRHIRSSKHARRYDSGNIEYLRASVAHPGDSDEMFFSVWMKMPSLWDGKMFRWDMGGPGNWWNPGDNNVALDDVRDWYPAQANLVGTWHRYYGVIKGRTLETQDQKFYILGHNGNAALDVAVSTAIATRIGAGNTNPMLGAGSTTPNQDGWAFDDLYVDFSQARVELANSADWSLVTYSEIQPPVAWSDTEIQFRANCGAFPDGALSHVHIIKADGTHVYWGQVTINDWQHGNVKTLTPDMFGLASFGADPNMRLFDTMDNQSVYDAAGDGDLIPVGPGNIWEGMTDNYSMVFETGAAQARHEHDTKRYKINERGFLYRPYALPYGHAFGKSMFLEWWIQRDLPLTADGSTKVIRVWADNSGNRRYISWTNNPQLALRPGTFWSGGLRPLTGWNRLTLEIDCTSPVLAEWRTRQYVNGVLVVDRFAHAAPDPGSTSAFNVDLDWGPPCIGLIGFDSRWPPADYADEYSDGRISELYMSVRPQRFVITDSATFTPTGAYEVQEIVSWAPDEAQIRVFEGALNGLAGKYVHFVGAGSVAQGTPFQIGV